MKQEQLNPYELSLGALTARYERDKRELTKRAMMAGLPIKNKPEPIEVTYDQSDYPLQTLIDGIDDLMAKYHFGEHLYSPERDEIAVLINEYRNKHDKAMKTVLLAYSMSLEGGNTEDVLKDIKNRISTLNV